MKIEALNPDGGFSAVVRSSSSANPAAVFDLAARIVTDAANISPELARAFLDSDMGERFASEIIGATSVTNDKRLENAIRKVTASWLERRIGGRIERVNGHPAPLGWDHLTGYAQTALSAEQEQDLHRRALWMDTALREIQQLYPNDKAIQDITARALDTGDGLAQESA